MKRAGATLVGASAILMWSGLAVLTRFAGDLPPLELTGFSFLIGGLLGSGFCSWRGTSPFLTLTNWKAWTVGVGGTLARVIHVVDQ